MILRSVAPTGRPIRLAESQMVPGHDPTVPGQGLEEVPVEEGPRGGAVEEDQGWLGAPGFLLQLRSSPHH